MLSVRIQFLLLVLGAKNGEQNVNQKVLELTKGQSHKTFLAMIFSKIDHFIIANNVLPEI
jgi:hypothetical protein